MGRVGKVRLGIQLILDQEMAKGTIGNLYPATRLAPVIAVTFRASVLQNLSNVPHHFLAQMIKSHIGPHQPVETVRGQGQLRLSITIPQHREASGVCV